MSTNISKQKREGLLNKIKEIRNNQNRRFNRRFAPPLKGVNTGFAPERGF